MDKSKRYIKLHKIASYFLFMGAITSILNSAGLFTYSEVPANVFIVNYPHFILTALQLIGIWIGSLLFIVYLLLLLFSSAHKKKI